MSDMRRDKQTSGRVQGFGPDSPRSVMTMTATTNLQTTRRLPNLRKQFYT